MGQTQIVDAVGKRGRALRALARLFGLSRHEVPLDLLGIDSRCRSRPCRRPAACRSRRCRRMKACQLAALSGWPWQIEGLTPGSLDYRQALFDSRLPPSS